MPKILIANKIIYAVFETDTFSSRLHINCYKADKPHFEQAKFWLEPTIRSIKQGGFTEKELQQLLEFITRHHQVLSDQLQKFYMGLEVAPIDMDLSPNVLPDPEPIIEIPVKRKYKKRKTKFLFIYKPIGIVPASKNICNCGSKILE